MFAHFLMRRTVFIAVALTAFVAAYLPAQTSSEHPKPHHETVHHPRTHHPAPPSSPEAKNHLRTMKQEKAVDARNDRTKTEGKASLKSERSASSEHRAEASRDARERRRHTVRPHTTKKHPSSTTHTIGESRYELERREAAESRSRFEEGYRAGFAAGLAARRSEATSACGAPPDTHDDSRSFASRSIEPAPVAESAPRVSDATVRSTTPISGDSASAGKNAAAIAGAHSRPEPASLDMAPGAHYAPVSLKASMLMLHEPVPAPLRGSLASLERQNSRLESEGLQRIEDESDLEYRVAHHLLVPLPVSDGLTVNAELSPLRRYCRPWTAEFLTDLARMHDAVFHRPLRVDSAVRTVDYQRRLIEINANAAPAEGDIASPHETGATIDISKKGMTWREIGWMRRYLLTLQNAGLIDVEEEFYQSCFHITVYDVYGRSPLRTAGTAGGDGTERTSDTASAASGTRGQ